MPLQVRTYTSFSVMDNSSKVKYSVGILGFGALGQYLYDAIISDPTVAGRLEVKYVWNRSVAALERVPKDLRLNSLEDVINAGADIVVEVCHPDVTRDLAAKVIRETGANFMVGSPTAFADKNVEDSLRAAAEAGNGRGNGGLYVPVGALWGAADLQALANRNGLLSVTITMKKHPAMLQLVRVPGSNLEDVRQQLVASDDAGEMPLTETLLYEGPVRNLCAQAPNNVNTMACCAMACHTLGFDGTVGRLVADARLTTHEIEIEALGKPNPATGQQFRMRLSRSSPAPKGAVTSKATYGSFLESLLKARGRGLGVHFV